MALFLDPGLSLWRFTANSDNPFSPAPLLPPPPLTPLLPPPPPPLSPPPPPPPPLPPQSSCCGYGSKGTGSRGYDCISIPGAENTAGNRLPMSRQCGGREGLGSMDTNNNVDKTICCECGNTAAGSCQEGCASHFCIKKLQHLLLV